MAKRLGVVHARWTGWGILLAGATWTIACTRSQPKTMPDPPVWGAASASAASGSSRALDKTERAGEQAQASGSPNSDAGTRSGPHEPSAPATSSQPVEAPTATGSEPPAVATPYPRTAKPADGQWEVFSPQAPTLRPAFWRTTLHPHPINHHVSVQVVAMDLRQLRVGWVVGAGDTGHERLKPFMTAGLVPVEDREKALAVFNGGFLARHGWWGQQSHGQVLVPPKAEGCGVALFTDGRIQLGLFSEFEADAALETYRQTPPCLVHEGEVNPSLSAGRDRIWAGKNQERKTRRRSALGVTSTNQMLFYLLGTEAEPLDLARALIALGAEAGLQLDINWNWTRFFLVAANEQGQPAVAEPLAQGMAHDRGEYFSRPSQRDFFFVVRR